MFIGCRKRSNTIVKRSKHFCGVAFDDTQDFLDRNRFTNVLVDVRVEVAPYSNVIDVPKVRGRRFLQRNHHQPLAAHPANRLRKNLAMR